MCWTNWAVSAPDVYESVKRCLFRDKAIVNWQEAIDKSLAKSNTKDTTGKKNK